MAKNALKELTDPAPAADAGPEAVKSKRWTVSVGPEAMPLALYHLRSKAPITADEAWTQYLKETGRSEPEGMEHRCTPWDVD